jgi:hypothetical protein
MPIRLPAVALAAVILAGCALPRIGPQTVEVPVPVPCLTPDKIPPRPDLMADAVWATGNEFDRAKALLVDRLRLLIHVGRLEPLLRACAAKD